MATSSTSYVGRGAKSNLLLHPNMNKNNVAVNYSVDLCARAVRELADLARQEDTVTQQQR